MTRSALPQSDVSGTGVVNVYAIAVLKRTSQPALWPGVRGHGDRCGRSADPGSVGFRPSLTMHPPRIYLVGISPGDRPEVVFVLMPLVASPSGRLARFWALITTPSSQKHDCC